MRTLGIKKIPVVPVPDRPYFFSTRLTVQPYFLQVVVGFCQNGVCCHTNYWKNREKNIQKKIISDLPTLIFSRYETGTTGIFLRPLWNLKFSIHIYCAVILHQFLYLMFSRNKPSKTLQNMWRRILEHRKHSWEMNWQNK